MDLESHPLADRYPLMEGAEFEAFKEDIRVNGCRVPVVLFEGRILDGRNRYRACKELGREPFICVFDGALVEAEAAVDSLNFHRRHLTAEFRRQRVVEMRARGMSLRKIAAAVGADVATVHADLKVKPSPVGNPTPPATPTPPGEATQTPPVVPPAPPKVTGRDGKQYAATRPQAKPAGNTPPEKKAQGAAASAKPSPETPADSQPETVWKTVAEQLAAVAKLIEAAPNPSKETKPWELVESLETAAKVMVEKARELRRRFHL